MLCMFEGISEFEQSRKWLLSSFWNLETLCEMWFSCKELFGVDERVVDPNRIGLMDWDVVEGREGAIGGRVFISMEMGAADVELETWLIPLWLSLLGRGFIGR